MRRVSCQCVRVDGGRLCAAITAWFGEQLPKRVQRYILENYYGEQPVGTSFLIDARRDGQKLIHTPTMRVPSKILDPAVVYQSMRTTLMTALGAGVRSLVIPVFGGRTGRVPDELAAKMMWLGYHQIMRPNRTIDRETVRSRADRWIALGVKNG